MSEWNHRMLYGFSVSAFVLSIPIMAIGWIIRVEGVGFTLMQISFMWTALGTLALWCGKIFKAQNDKIAELELQVRQLTQQIPSRMYSTDPPATISQ